MPLKWILGISVLCASATLADAQPASLDEGYRKMYNLQFADAHTAFQEWERLHPDDPMGPVSDAAAYLFSEFDRLHILQSEFFTHDEHFITDHKLTPDPGLKRRFEADLETTRKLAARAPGDTNAMFATILATGLHSDYLALIEKRYVASFKEMKSARMQAERLLGVDPGCYDAWVAVGVENYMLGIKPLVMRWFLRAAGAQANREIGIEKLRLVADKGHYLAPFARLLLAVTALRSHDVKRAHDLLAGLAREFPRNPLYAQELARMNTTALRSSNE